MNIQAIEIFLDLQATTKREKDEEMHEYRSYQNLCKTRVEVRKVKSQRSKFASRVMQAFFVQIAVCCLTFISPSTNVGACVRIHR